ncbi:DUF1707 SHOCT-like domain-containing protein [Streptosporangium sp. DT93]|uniref:DUF1707 SHOCT-like domain-containing protein n=1 Tax=Streptosporangium sp. DT93 TaxID=3393428 RepID=UPI003CF8555D
MTPREGLRIGDAEREAAMEFLRENYAQGRLTREELDERLEVALSARTSGDLALVGADLPGPHTSGIGSAEDAGRTGGAGAPWDPEGPWAWAAGPWGHGRGPGGHGSRRREGRHPWGGHHGDAWKHHRAAAEYRRRKGRGGPPIPPPLILLLVAGVVFTGFGVLKVLLAIALVATVVGLVRRRRGHREHRRARLSPPGAF